MNALKGELYVKVPARLFHLPTSERAAAIDVWAALQFDLRIDSSARRVTDKALMKSPSLRDRSAEHARKGIEILEREGLIVRNARGSSRSIKITTEFRKAMGPEFRDEYHAYLMSDVWTVRKHAARAAAGGRCQICNYGGRLDVHHRTYERIGNELPTDVVVLCRQCHRLFHESGRLATAPPAKEVG